MKLNVQPRKTNNSLTILVESDLKVRDILVASEVKPEILTTKDADGNAVFTVAAGSQGSLSGVGVVLPITYANKDEELKVEFPVSLSPETLPYYVVEYKNKIAPIFEAIADFIASVEEAKKEVQYA